MKSLAKSNLYTNSIVTMISADGVNHTSCVLYTFNPKFAPTQKKTPRGDEIRAAFVEALARYGIAEVRIYYLKSGKHYRAECPEIYEHFLSWYQVTRDACIFHDNGNAYKRGKTSIFETMGYKNHVTYPSEVHPYLSPNDNSLHGCKSTWRRDYFKLDDDVSSSLRLMQLIDEDATKNSKYYFDRNILYVGKSDLDSIIGG